MQPVIGPWLLRLPASPSAARPALWFHPAQLGCVRYAPRHRALAPQIAGFAFGGSAGVAFEPRTIGLRPLCNPLSGLGSSDCRSRRSNTLWRSKIDQPLVMFSPPPPRAPCGFGKATSVGAAKSSSRWGCLAPLNIGPVAVSEKQQALAQQNRSAACDV